VRKIGLLSDPAMLRLLIAAKAGLLPGLPAFRVVTITGLLFSATLAGYSAGLDSALASVEAAIAVAPISALMASRLGAG
jgi:hypothetical protein